MKADKSFRGEKKAPSSVVPAAGGEAVTTGRE